jgi:hypothetical protein
MHALPSDWQLTVGSHSTSRNSQATGKEVKSKVCCSAAAPAALVNKAADHTHIRYHTTSITRAIPAAHTCNCCTAHALQQLLRQQRLGCATQVLQQKSGLPCAHHQPPLQDSSMYTIRLLQLAARQQCQLCKRVCPVSPHQQTKQSLMYTTP